MNRSPRPIRVLAVSSGGGHWIQLQRLKTAFEGHDIRYATVGPCDTSGVAPAPVQLIPDANAKTPLRMAWLIFSIGWLVLRMRPYVVITTGAAPGYWAIRWGRLLGARTVFIDSIANAEQLSLSGRLAVKHADVTLTQWSDLARQDGPQFWGAVV